MRLLLFLLGIVVGALGVLVVQQLVVDRLQEATVTFGSADLHPDITVTLSEGLLTALVRQSIARGESPVPLENVQVTTGNGRVIVRGDVVVVGRRVGGVMEMEPQIEENHLVMRLRHARLGPVPVPPNVERLAEGPINARLAATIGDLPATLTSARATDDGLTVTARVNVQDLLGLPR